MPVTLPECLFIPLVKQRWELRSNVVCMRAFSTPILPVKQQSWQKLMKHLGWSSVYCSLLPPPPLQCWLVKYKHEKILVYALTNVLCTFFIFQYQHCFGEGSRSYCSYLPHVFHELFGRIEGCWNVLMQVYMKIRTKILTGI